MDGVSERLLRGAAERGLTQESVAGAVVAHEVAGLAVMLGAWGACYAARPARALYRSEALHRAAPGFRARADKTVERVRASRAYRVVSRRVSERAAVAFAESAVLRRAAAPVTVPLKLWVTWKAVGFFGPTAATK